MALPDPKGEHRFVIVGRRSFARRKIGQLKRTFESTSDAAAAWEAYGLARASSLPIPDWILSYFDTCAARTFVLRFRVPKSGQIYKAVADAMGFRSSRSGPKNPFAQSKEYAEEMRIMLEILHVLDHSYDGWREDESCVKWTWVLEQINRLRSAHRTKREKALSDSKMRRVWKKHREWAIATRFTGRIRTPEEL